MLEQALGALKPQGLPATGTGAHTTPWGSWAMRASSATLGNEPERARSARGRWALYQSLTMTYFHTRAAHYHRRVGVSLSCSGWEGVGPPSYGRQA